MLISVGNLFSIFLLFMLMLGNNSDGNYLFIVIHCITLNWFEPSYSVSATNDTLSSQERC